MKNKKIATSSYNHPNESLIEDRAYWLNKALTLKESDSKTNMFEFAPENIQRDEEINYLAVISGNKSVHTLHACFLSNKSFILKCLNNLQYKDKSFSLWSLHDDIRDDEEINLLAYQLNVFNLALSSYNIHYNKSFLKKAMAINGLGFEYIKDTNDLELATIAFEQNPKMIVFAKKSIVNKLCKDTARIEELLKSNINYLAYIGFSLRNNLKFMKPYLDKSPMYISCAGKKIKDNKEYMRYFLNKFHPHGLYNCSERLRSDSSFCLEFIKKDPSNVSAVSWSLRKDIDFVREMMRQQPLAYQHLYDEQLKDSTVLYFALQADENWQHVPNEVKAPFLDTIREEFGEALSNDECKLKVKIMMKRVYAEQYLRETLTDNKAVKNKLKI